HLRDYPLASYYWYRAHRDLHFSLHDALPIYRLPRRHTPADLRRRDVHARHVQPTVRDLDLRLLDRVPGARQHDQLREARELQRRSEEHTSELQSRENLVCRLLLEKKKN